MFLRIPQSGCGHSLVDFEFRYVPELGRAKFFAWSFRQGPLWSRQVRNFGDNSGGGDGDGVLVLLMVLIAMAIR